jgi:hypothetical protein
MKNKLGWPENHTQFFGPKHAELGPVQAMWVFTAAFAPYAVFLDY